MLKRLIYNDEGMIRSPAAYALIGLTVLALGVVAYRVWMAGERATKGTWICWECARPSEVDPDHVDALPAKCPLCGRRSLVPGFSCPKCSAPVALNEYRGRKPPTQCPKCGSEVSYGE